MPAPRVGRSDVEWFGPSDVAGRVGLRADVSADEESAAAGSQTPEQHHSANSHQEPQNLPRPVWTGGNKATKPAIKTTKPAIKPPFLTRFCQPSGRPHQKSR